MLRIYDFSGFNVASTVSQSLRLGEILLRKKQIQDSDLEKALELQSGVGGRLGSILVRTGALSEDVLLRALSEQLSFTYLSKPESFPDSLQVYQFMVDSPIKIDWFIDKSVILWPDGGGLGCLARDPLDSSVTETIKYFYSDVEITYYLAANHHLDQLIEFVRKEIAVEALFASGSARQLRAMAEEAPVIELVNNILAQAVDAGASDIHIEPNEQDFAVRLRVDGVLYTQFKQPIKRFPAVASRVKLISGIDIAERRLPQDGRITTRISGQEMDVRVSTAPCVHGESVVMRLLPKERKELSLRYLGMEADHLSLFESWLKAANGVVLVTGPTGSGKSTTLYSALDDTNDGDKKIITVEDPVEYQVPNITQIQAHSEIGYSFARALRAILRQDPDVIMIGEIRDLETAEIAIQSALTGHLVLSTLHTNDAVSAFTRLIDMGVEPFLVAAPMRGVQAQRLVRKVCLSCAEPAHVPEAMEKDVQGLPKEYVGNSWLKAVGCDACHHTGYRGRTGIYEMVPMTLQMQDLIVSGGTLNQLRQLAAENGYRTLFQDGLIKASKGITTLDEVSRVALLEQ